MRPWWEPIDNGCGLFESLHMNFARLAYVATLLVAALAMAQPVAAPALLQVTVTDPYGRFVTGLGQNSFHVFEDGMEQSVAFFSDKEGTATVDIGAVGTFQVELHNQYLIGYRPANRAGSAGPRKIEVQVRSAGLPPLQTRLLPVYYPR